MDPIRIHIAGNTTPKTFLPRLLNRLQQSSSPLLRERLSNWRQSRMRNLGLSLDYRVQLIGPTVRRIATDCTMVADEFERDKESLSDCLATHRAFVFTRTSLELEILLDVHGFLFQLRSSIELLEAFLLAFFDGVLDKKETSATIRARLRASGLDNSWVDRLWTLRDLVTHEATPPVAVEILSTDPISFELLVLRGFPSDNGDFPLPTPLSELLDFYGGFQDHLRLIEDWLIAEIRSFEQLDPQATQGRP